MPFSSYTVLIIIIIIVTFVISTLSMWSLSDIYFLSSLIFSSRNTCKNKQSVYSLLYSLIPFLPFHYSVFMTLANSRGHRCPFLPDYEFYDRTEYSVYWKPLMEIELQVHPYWIRPYCYMDYIFCKSLYPLCTCNK